MPLTITVAAIVVTFLQALPHTRHNVQANIDMTHWVLTASLWYMQSQLHFTQMDMEAQSLSYQLNHIGMHGSGSTGLQRQAWLQIPSCFLFPVLINRLQSSVSVRQFGDKIYRAFFTGLLSAITSALRSMQYCTSAKAFLLLGHLVFQLCQWILSAQHVCNR